VRFGLPVAGRARMALYDGLGRELKVLVDGELPSGLHHVSFDSAAMAPGLYVVRLTVSGVTEARAVVVGH